MILEFGPHKIRVCKEESEIILGFFDPTQRESHGCIVYKDINEKDVQVTMVFHLEIRNPEKVSSALQTIRHQIRLHRRFGIPFKFVGVLSEIVRFDATKTCSFDLMVRETMVRETMVRKTADWKTTNPHQVLCTTLNNPLVV